MPLHQSPSCTRILSCSTSSETCWSCSGPTAPFASTASRWGMMGTLSCFPPCGTDFLLALLLHLFCFFFFFDLPVQTQLPVWSWCRRCLCLATSLTQPSWSPSLWPLCAQKLVLHWKPHSRYRNTNPQTHTHTRCILTQPLEASCYACPSQGVHGRKHHVESGWPADHAAERPFGSTGTRQGDTCQQQEGGEMLLLVFQL